MSSDGSIELFWGDGMHKFKFGIGQFRELQEKINLRRIQIGAPIVGPLTLLKAIEQNDAWPDDIRDVLRIGLVGGGAKPQDVHRLLANHFDTSGPLNHMKAAHTALLAGLVGSPVEESESKKKTSPDQTTTSSSSQESTGQVLQ